MNIRKVLTKDRLRRPPLRVQLTVLYAGLFGALVAAVLGVSGLLVGRQVEVAPLQFTSSKAAPAVASGHHFDAGPAIVGLVAVVVGFGLAWWIAGRFLRPLHAMNTAAQEISATNLHRRLGLDGPDDELTQLGRTLDDLFGRLEASFEAQRHFVANASHELRTPLAGQRTLLQVALADPAASTLDLRAACEETLQLGDQQERLIDGLLTLATSERGIEQWEPFDLGEITDTVLLGRRQHADSRGVHIDTSLVAASGIGDARLVESLVANLIDNAISHNTPGGRIEISTISASGRATITVNNTGPVVPPDQIDRLLQPFQQTGRERVRPTDGHGLGLAIVRAIAQAHRATLTGRARPEGGLEIQVSFPTSQT
jgi:signal transduction histidine kinase